MERELVLTSTAGSPSATAAVTNKNGITLAAWSADNMTHIKPVLNSTSSIEEPTMIKHPDNKFVLNMSKEEKTFWPSSSQPSVASEDIHLIALDDGDFLLAMLEPSFDDRIGGAYLTKISKDLATQKTVRLGPAGDYSCSISAAVWENSVIIAWHDGSFNGSRLRLALVNPISMEIEKSSLFQGTGPAAGPSVSIGKSGPAVVWSETKSSGTSLLSKVNIARISRDLEFNEIRTVEEGRFLSPSPHLISTEKGFALIYRDDADKDNTPEFYFITLGFDGSTNDYKKRISQSDGLKGPRLTVLGDYFVSVTIRSFQRNLLIGLNRFDSKGAKKSGEFQVYADKTDFVCADVANTKNGLIIVYGEDKRTKGRVLAGEITCSMF